MKTEFKDVAHLYLGCKCIVDGSNKAGIFSGLDFCQSDKSIIMVTVRYSDDIEDWDVYNDDQDLLRIKPILYPLSAMADEQINQCNNISSMAIPRACVYSKITKLLFDNHFDLFGLIESGQAIDATTLTT